MEKESKKKSETDESVPPSRSKVGLKFAPKAPKNVPKKTIPKAESHDDSKVTVVDKELLLRMRILKNDDAHGSRVKAEKQGTPAVKLPKNHDDPWDYTCTNCPVTLPFGRSYSRDSDVDEDELGQSSSRAHGSEPNAAEKLGLMGKVDERQLFFFQFPRSLPLQRQADSVAESDTDTNVDAESSGKRKLNPICGRRLRELPGGLMGKILVFKSGKVKMKLGDAPFDVSAGSSCSFAQEAVAVDTRENYCISLGEVRERRAIVTPDTDYLLGCVQME